MGKNKKKKGLMTLNKEQEAAANSIVGIAAVIAVPGSGKTLTMTRRIGNLVQLHNVSPERILGLTFTRNAADKKIILGTRKSILICICFYVGSSCQAFFVFRLLKSPIPEPEVKRPSLRRRPASPAACPGRGVKVAGRLRETLTPRRGMLKTSGRGEKSYPPKQFLLKACKLFWLVGSGESMAFKDLSSFYPC